MKKQITIHWFRQDLRLSDNPSLSKAAREGTVLPIYILDDLNAGSYKMGAASQFWLHHSLAALDKSLDHQLSLYQGDPLQILEKLCDRYRVEQVVWNRCYEPWCIKRDTVIKEALICKGIAVHSENGSLLWEPWTVTKEDKTPYKVFTPFYRKGCLSAPLPRKPLPKPTQLMCIQDTEKSVALNALGLLPQQHWDKKMQNLWEIGEHGAHMRLAEFLNTKINHYKVGRDFPAQQHVSRLSPHLHFGEISPNQVYYATRELGNDHNVDHFCSELGWREFSYNQLYFNPNLPEENLQKKFNLFPWKNNLAQLKAWQKGQTGVPFVDAGMRQLWQTGYMHNRVRMVVGSFLVKNLLIDWRYGERWFWDCLVDADLANNSASWQWVAGCGADAAPYFRIFNPVTQGQKFDPDGNYVRKFVPELKKLPTKYLFDPWAAPMSVIEDAGIELGQDYPKPTVDLAQSREAALRAFEKIKK